MVPKMSEMSVLYRVFALVLKVVPKKMSKMSVFSRVFNHFFRFSESRCCRREAGVSKSQFSQLTWGFHGSENVGNVGNVGFNEVFRCFVEVSPQNVGNVGFLEVFQLSVSLWCSTVFCIFVSSFYRRELSGARIRLIGVWMGIPKKRISQCFF